MKKLVIAAALIGVVLNATSAFADNLGYVDFDKIVTNSKEAKTLREVLTTKQADLQKLFDDKNKDIEKARKANKKDNDIKKMVEKIQKELQPKQEELQQLTLEGQNSILAKIKTAAQTVGKTVGIDVVIDKRMVITGGYDLTDLVLEQINK